MERTGRPRDPLIDDAVRDAAVEVLSQVGYARLTVFRSVSPGVLGALLGSFVHYRVLFDHASTDAGSVTGAVLTLLRGMAAGKPDHTH